MHLTTLPKRFYIFIAVLFIAIVYVYYYLGGFKEIEVRAVSQDALLVAGQYFEGKYSSDTVQNLVDSAYAYIQAHSSANFTVINFSQYENEQGRIKQLIGFSGEQMHQPFPSDFEMDTFEIQESVRAVIHKHYWVRPNPYDVNQKMKAYAQQHNLTLGEYTIERYISDREMWVDIPVIEP